MTQQTPSEPLLQVAPSPHLHASHLSTQRVMLDVLIALIPVCAVSCWVFRWYALKQLVLCELTALLTETLCAALRRRKSPVWDLSASVTAVLLALSLPWNAPAYIAIIATVVAIGLGKAAFGGLGFNLFNPAMVGRAFVMLSFAREMGASGYVAQVPGLDVISQATPLTAAKQYVAALASGAPVADSVQTAFQNIPPLSDLFLGIANGSLGETSVGAICLGGLYLCIRKTIAREIPVCMLLTAAAMLGLMQLLGLTDDGFGALHHLGSGALFLGAFFIATDPVTSPLTRRGRCIFAAGLGALICLFRALSSYPEGVMFAVLFMNAMVPLINRYTIRKPIGGPVPGSAASPKA